MFVFVNHKTRAATTVVPFKSVGSRPGAGFCQVEMRPPQQARVYVHFLLYHKCSRLLNGEAAATVQPAPYQALPTAGTRLERRGSGPGGPGGGGASFAEMTMISGMLVHGMLIYSGGISQGQPYLHFGAVSHRAPDEDLYRERCLKLGENIARKAVELFG